MQLFSTNKTFKRGGGVWRSALCGNTARLVFRSASPGQNFISLLSLILRPSQHMMPNLSGSIELPDSRAESGCCCFNEDFSQGPISTLGFVSAFFHRTYLVGCYRKGDTP